jgi:tetratricopeptide (TPR) repeat protein
MNNRHWGRIRSLPAWAGIWVGLALLGGCNSTLLAVRVSEMNEAYAQSDYEKAYRLARKLVERASGHDRDTAAFVAGLSSRKLGADAAAQRYLQVASDSSDRLLAADSLSQLGLIYAAESRYEASARVLLRCAPMYAGIDRANAYYYAAIAQQKLGRWPQARTNLYLARCAAGGDRAFTQRVAEQLAVSGYTLQIGAYRQSANARAAADRIGPGASQLRLGKPRLVSATDSAGKGLTLVQIGEFALFASAQQVRKALNQPNAIIVPLGKGS